MSNLESMFKDQDVKIRQLQAVSGSDDNTKHRKEFKKCVKSKNKSRAKVVYFLVMRRSLVRTFMM